MKYNIANAGDKKQAEARKIRGKTNLAQDFHYLIKFYW